jgi:hypothetical protein
MVDSLDIFSDIDRLIDGNMPKKDKHVSGGLVTLKRAPNPVVFAESEEFIYLEEPLFPFQFKTLRDFFELLCPVCNDVTRIQTKDDVPRADQILFEYDKCPYCGLYKFDIEDHWYMYSEFVGCGGMRGSKSTLAALIAHWLTHEALCTENLQTKLGLLKTQTIEGAFVAVSLEQAEETVWDHFLNMYRESPWYRNYKKALKQIERSHDNDHRAGDLLKDDATTYIHFKDRNLRLRALHSNSGSIAGRTRLFSIIDELSRFDSGESRRSANEVYRVMKRSLATLTAAVNRLNKMGVYNIPLARMISISSPLYKEDKTMRLVGQSSDIDRMYSFHATTLEMNPNITMEDLQPEFDADPVGAERDYFAQPPGAENPFVRDKNLIQACTDPDRPNMFDLKEVPFEVKHDKTGMVFNYIRVDVINMRWQNLLDYFIHCDAGETGDSFCIGIGHEEDGVAVIDGGIEIRPIPERNRMGLDPRKVHFPSVTQLLLDLNDTLSISAISYDKWNSVDQIQRLIDSGILAISKNISRDHHVKFLNSMKSGKVRFPKKEKDNVDPKLDRNIPCAKALYELNRLNDNGVKVDHPSDCSNDMIQCYIGVHRLILTPEEVLGKKAVDKVRKKPPVYTKPRSIGRVVRLRR